MDALDRRLLDAYQRGFPLTPAPFAAIAEALGIAEAEVLTRLDTLKANGVIGRIGAVFRPGTVGASTLAAMEVPQDRLAEVAAVVSAQGTVNHNYEREHAINLWFVAAGDTEADVEASIAAIEAETGLSVMRLPLVEAYHLDLGFPLSWD